MATKIKKLSIADLEIQQGRNVSFLDVFEDVIDKVKINVPYRITEEQKEFIKEKLGLNRNGKMSYVDRELQLGLTVRKLNDGTYSAVFWVPMVAEIAD